MIPRTLIDSARIPGSDEELRLMKRGSEFSIMLGQNELMNSRLSGSEEALAKLACARIGNAPGARMLIGGLGMGFSLRAALSQLGADVEIVVAELIPSVLSWARGPMADVFGGCLADPRVQVRIADVRDVIVASVAIFDAIVLDVDNGPEGLVREANEALYNAKGLKAARRALRPRGVLAVWSSGPNRKFGERLREAGFDVEEIRIRANASGGGARHVIWLAGLA